MMTLAEACPVFVPQFKLCTFTSKENILKLCLQDQEISAYLPSKDNLDEIDKSFLIMVSKFNRYKS